MQGISQLDKSQDTDTSVVESVKPSQTKITLSILVEQLNKLKSTLDNDLVEAENILEELAIQCESTQWQDTLTHLSELLNNFDIELLKESITSIVERHH